MTDEKSDIGLSTAGHEAVKPCLNYTGSPLAPDHHRSATERHRDALLGDISSGADPVQAQIGQAKHRAAFRPIANITN